ncbi:hypothetical protein NTGBS_1180003 [Candidatus Nitrotoga sp. BS]|nr:hypothetical protein NTGBS_1180003 [Candidatus Nitrotoga sp. BS]
MFHNHVAHALGFVRVNATVTVQVRYRSWPFEVISGADTELFILKFENVNVLKNVGGGKANSRGTLAERCHLTAIVKLLPHLLDRI